MYLELRIYNLRLSKITLNLKQCKMGCRLIETPLGGVLTWIEWLMGNGETSFTFSLLTFS